MYHKLKMLLIIEHKQKQTTKNIYIRPVLLDKQKEGLYKKTYMNIYLVHLII